jgi:integrase
MEEEADHVLEAHFASKAMQVLGDLVKQLRSLDIPEDVLPSDLPAKLPEEVSLSSEALLSAWAAERRPAPATLRKYKGAFRQVTRVLGIEDLRKISRDAAVKFKEVRLGEGKDPGTVADEMITLSTLYKWAVVNAKVTENPFAGLAPKPPSRGSKPRDKYSEEEASAILKAARKETGWRCWLPWLLAFSGARIGEIVGMRRCDVRQEQGVWILDFKPLPGRAGKNETFQRMVPLHPAVISEGFLNYVDGLPTVADGPLFPDISTPKGADPISAATTMHTKWVRSVAKVTRTGTAPAHSWRHRMEDELRAVDGMRDEIADAITGRKNTRNAGAGYGIGYRKMPKETAKFLAQIPKPPGLG